MSILSHLAGFVVRQSLGDGAEKVLGAVRQRFSDHADTLSRALARASDRSWRALAVALAGDGFADRLQVFVAAGDEKGLREQVQAFLASCPLEVPVTMPRFRQLCLAELQEVVRSGQTRTDSLTGDRVGQAAVAFQRYTDPQGLIAGATEAVTRVAGELGPRYPNLSRLLSTPTPAGPPLLASAFAYFFRREVETDDELANGLLFDGLKQLSAAQARGFLEMNKALTSLGDRFDQLLEQLSRIETAVVQTAATTAATHQAVLDLGAELDRLRGLQQTGLDSLRGLMQDVFERLGRAGMGKGEVRPQHSCSIRDGEERKLVRTMVARFNALSPGERGRAPALLNGLGKLLVGTGEYAAAGTSFRAVARVAPDASSQAEALHNAYRAALELRKWDEGLECVLGAARRDPGRFAPFPLDRYEPKKILGAGGFGTAFLCHDRNFGDDVVIKTLHAAELDRAMKEVFAEAIVLRKLSHPAIIAVQDCEYADRQNQARPYIVMEYFEGENLDEHLARSGPLPPAELVGVARPVAQAMQAAHSRGILHRDIKPANLLVRRGPDGWAVKVIDFGLALRRGAGEGSVGTLSGDRTVAGEALAGTIKYAPPEQMGGLPGVKPGPYSDVYAFGKLCCQALFGTTEPRRRQWASIPEPLAEVLEKCIEEPLDQRHPDFAAVLRGLERSEGNAVIVEVLDALPAAPARPGAKAQAGQGLPVPQQQPALQVQPPRASQQVAQQLAGPEERGAAILSILGREFRGMSNPYLHPNIPARKLRNAQAAYAKFLPAGDVVLLVYDGTMFGAANEGFIFSHTGFGFCDTFSSPVWLPYRLVQPDEIMKSNYTNISVNGTNCFVYASDIERVVPALQRSLREVKDLPG